MKKCLRCSHTWKPRNEHPKACPSCKSYRWHLSKTLNARIEEVEREADVQDEERIVVPFEEA